MAAEAPALRITDLRVDAASGRTVLSVPRLAVPAGGSLGVRGPSGSGKSTFLFAIAGLISRMSGSVAWGDTDLALASPADRTRFRAAHVGMVFQDFLLFDELGSLANAAIPALYSPAAERKGIRARAAALLNGLGVPDEDRPVPTFSGGERQRIAVARALARDADILLADEPTANLDRATAAALTEDLLGRAGRATVVVISHDDMLLERMDRVVEIRDGLLDGGDA